VSLRQRRLPSAQTGGEVSFSEDPEMRLYAIPFILLISLPAFAQTASISGVVTGDDGKSLAAVVTVNGVVPLRASGHAESSANGAFTVGNLPAGTYHVCADIKGGGYLDPCAWEPITPTVQVAAGQTVTGYRLTAKKGTLLQVRVNDPAGVLSASSPPQTGKAAAPQLLVGVFTTRHLFQPLVVAAKDATGMSQQGTVPQGVPVSLHVSGKGVQITDSKGASVNASGALSTVQPNGLTLPTVTLTVSATPAKP
jgi:hypothetical protein